MSMQTYQTYVKFPEMSSVEKEIIPQINQAFNAMHVFEFITTARVKFDNKLRYVLITKMKKILEEGGKA